MTSRFRLPSLNWHAPTLHTQPVRTWICRSPANRENSDGDTAAPSSAKTLNVTTLPCGSHTHVRLRATTRLVCHGIGPMSYRLQVPAQLRGFIPGTVDTADGAPIAMHQRSERTAGSRGETPCVARDAWHAQLRQHAQPALGAQNGQER